MRALLHDAGAVAIIFADDDQRAAGDSAGGQIRERVGGDVGADGGFEGDCAAERIVDGGGESGGGGGFGSAVLEVDAEFFEDVVGVGENVHQVRDWSALIAGHVGDAGLQQGFCDGEDAFAAKFLALAQVEFLDFFFEEPLRHLSGPVCRSLQSAMIRHS